MFILVHPYLTPYFWRPFPRLPLLLLRLFILHLHQHRHLLHGLRALHQDGVQRGLSGVVLHIGLHHVELHGGVASQVFPGVLEPEIARKLKNGGLAEPQIFIRWNLGFSNINVTHILWNNPPFLETPSGATKKIDGRMSLKIAEEHHLDW